MPLWLIGGILLAFAAKGLALLVGSSVGAYAIEMRPDPQPAAALAGVVAMAAISTFFPSIAEDIVTRGFWWRLGGRLMRGWSFVLLTSLIYVLNHIYRLAEGPAEWLRLFCFGLAYGAAIARTGSLWAAVGVHWGWNLSNALLDQFLAVESEPALTPLISAGAHLAMLAIILAIPGRPLWADLPEDRRSGS